MIEVAGAAHQRALQVGRAAEHLVVADLLLQGHEAFLTEAGMGYDIVVESPGRLLRLQVKSTTRPRNANSQGRNPRMAYVWNVRQAGKKGRKRLSAADCDLVALVALDIRAVAYATVRACGATVILQPPECIRANMVESATLSNRGVWAGDVTQYPFRAALCAL